MWSTNAFHNARATLGTLFEVLMSPRDFFSRQIPDYSLAFLAIVLLLFLNITLSSLYFFIVDIDWLRESTLGNFPIPPEKAAIVAKLITREFLLASQAISATIRLAAVIGATSLYCWFIGRLWVKSAPGFGSWFCLMALSFLPLMFDMVSSLAMVAMAGDTRFMLSAVAPLSLNALALGLPSGHALHGVATGLTLPLAWCVWLQGLALSARLGMPVRLSVSLAAAPYVVVFVGWAAIALSWHG